MSLIQLFEHGERKSQIGHFRNLLAIARADGTLTSEEESVLERISRHLGLTVAQLEEVKNHPDRYPMHPPVGYRERLSRLAEMVEMLVADGEVDQLELNVLYRFAAGLGFQDQGTAKVVNKVLAGIREGQDHDTIADELNR